MTARSRLDPDKTEIFLGPPGTGKTHTLLNIVEDAIASGISPKKIAFISFTKKASEEGRARAIERYEIDPDDLPYFRTLHSLAFKQVAMRRNELVSRKHILNFGSIVGLDFQGEVDEDLRSMTIPDRMLFLENLSRTKMTPLKSEWEEANDDEVDWLDLSRTQALYQKFKSKNGLYDFTDILELFLTSDRAWCPKLDMLIIDEAQDLSRIQWECVIKLASGASRVIIGGDDDQSIYEWSGADVRYFINLKGKQTVLSKSRRVPRTVQRVALKITNSISNRKKKTWMSRDSDGKVEWVQDLSQLPLDSGQWLMLARNGYHLKQMEEYCLSSGLPFKSPRKNPLGSASLKAILCWEDLRSGKFRIKEDVREMLSYVPFCFLSRKGRQKLTDDLEDGSMVNLEELADRFSLKTKDIWHKALTELPAEDVAFFLAARKKGEKLLSDPRITISTIHSAKGGESENVFMMTDISKRCFDSMDTVNGLDAESRVFYVGVTRSRSNLYVMEPQTDLYFDMME